MPDSLLLSSDLFFASRIKSAAQAAGFVMSMGKSIEKVTINEGLKLVVVDLVTTGSTPEEIAQQVREHAPDARLIAFGPHVQTGRLAEAKNANFDLVLTRGQLDRGLAQLFVLGD